MRTILLPIFFVLALTCVADGAPLSGDGLKNLLATIRQNRSTQAASALKNRSIASGQRQSAGLLRAVRSTKKAHDKSRQDTQCATAGLLSSIINGMLAGCQDLAPDRLFYFFHPSLNK